MSAQAGAFAFSLAGLAAVAVGASPASAPVVRLEPLPHAVLTLVSENNTGFDAHALGEWGLSVLVEAGRQRLLFDTGGGRVLVDNARALEVDLSRLDAIVLSHGHGDHTGGLPKALELAGKVDVYLHPAGFDPFFLRAGSGIVRSAMPMTRDELTARARRVIETRGPTPVGEGLMVTGAVPRLTGFEDTGVVGLAFSDEGLTRPDPVSADQALFFRVREGIVLLLGCGHSGVVNTMRYVSELLGEPRIYAVIGGTHLLRASPARLEATAQALREHGVQKVMLCHCTGIDAYAALSRALPGRCSWPASGARLEFGR